MPTTFIVPSFSSALSVASGAAFSQALGALDHKGNALPGGVNWAIVAGLDKALFSISGGNLQMTAKNKLSPVDSNADNIYEVTLQASEPKYGFCKFYSVAVSVV